MSVPPPLLVYLARSWGRWSAEVSDPASPAAGLTVLAVTRRGALRRIVAASAHELGLCGELRRMEVVEWRAATYELSRR